MYQFVKLYNQDVKVKDYYCCDDPSVEYKSELKLHLYIKVTDVCPAHCAFCSNQNDADFGTLDLKKLRRVITYLQDTNRLHGISITGGEPLVVPDTVNEVLNIAFEIGGPQLNVSISTNGYQLQQLQQMDHIDQVESIHVSRHHNQDAQNNAIFHLPVAQTSDLRQMIQSLKNERQLVLNCLLMKSQINSIKAVKQYLEYAAQVGVTKVGFVSLMRSNPFCFDNFINFNELFSQKEDQMLEAHHFYDKNICECLDGIYCASNGRLVEYYARMTKELECPYTRQLVYTTDNHLTTGFGKKALI